MQAVELYGTCCTLGVPQEQFHFLSVSECYRPFQQIRVKHCCFRNAKILFFKTVVNSLHTVIQNNIYSFFLCWTDQNKLPLIQHVNEIIVIGTCFRLKIHFYFLKFTFAYGYLLLFTYKIFNFKYGSYLTWLLNCHVDKLDFRVMEIKITSKICLKLSGYETSFPNISFWACFGPSLPKQETKEKQITY